MNGTSAGLARGGAAVCGAETLVEVAEIAAAS